MYSIIDIESNGAGYRKECIIDIAITGMMVRKL
jgi:DNA polymerase-3 subunit epsilon